MTPAALLEALVATPSVSGQEGRIADQVATWAEGWGARVQRQGHNVWFSVGSGPKRLLVNSHLDTVPPCAGWTLEPQVPVWREGKLYGLGSNDAKGCVTAMLLAAAACWRTRAPWRAGVRSSSPSPPRRRRAARGWGRCWASSGPWTRPWWASPPA